MSKKNSKTGTEKATTRAASPDLTNATVIAEPELAPRSRSSAYSPLIQRVKDLPVGKWLVIPPKDIASNKTPKQIKARLVSMFHVQLKAREGIATRVQITKDGQIAICRQESGVAPVKRSAKRAK